MNSQGLTSILNQIQSLSGLQINFQKSVYLLSPKLHDSIPNDHFFSHNEEFPFRLILPWSLLGLIYDKITNKLAIWDSSLLSRVDRTSLIKSITLGSVLSDYLNLLLTKLIMLGVVSGGAILMQEKRIVPSQLK